MIIIIKICVEAIVAILLYLGLATSRAEHLKLVFRFIVSIGVLAAIAGFCWFFI